MKNNIEKVEGFKSRKEWEDAVWLKVLNRISGIKNRKELEMVLGTLISFSERNIILKRFLAMALIKEKRTYKEIGEILWISPSTIRSIKKNMESGGYKYKSRRDFDKKEGGREFKKEKIFKRNPILDWFNSLPPMPKKVGKRWSFLKNYPQ